MSDLSDRSRRLARKRYWSENEKQSYTCPDCGRSSEDIIGTFEVHHMGSNPHDNRLDNLIGLCGFCHRLREDKKPSLRRIKKFQTAAGETGEPPVHSFVLSFIEARVCLCSEGRGNDWVDPCGVWFDALDNHLAEYGYKINDKFKTELVSALRLIEEARLEWVEGRFIVHGPDPNGKTNCDCLTREDLTNPDTDGDWR